MSRHNNNPIPWKLGIFPLLEVFFIVLAFVAGNHFLSFLFVIVSGIFLSFSIHIFFHECVHLRDAYPLPFNIIATLFLGLPFDGYRLHHFNHHTHVNGLKDFSTTWFEKNGIKRPFLPCRYSFGWLRQLSRAIHEPDPFDTSLGDLLKIKSRIKTQKLALFLFIILLAFVSLKAFILYLALVYFGWAFSALHNYGQHPPIMSEPICTYPNKIYNSLFFNNGLHWEHHNKPWLSWNQLTLNRNSSRIRNAHLIQPCIIRRKHDQ